MRGIWLLSLRHLQHTKLATAVLVLCIGIAVFIPVATQVLIAAYQADLEARAAETPLLLGAKGGRSELTLSSLYFRRETLDPLPFPSVQRVRKTGWGDPIPLHVGFTARGAPIVGTTPDYYRLRGLRPQRGSLPTMMGEVVLGATAAREFELGPGDALFSDQKEVYDISKPPALKMRVCGVLGARGTPDDDAVFVDVKSCWIMLGLYHGHDPAESAPAHQVIGRADGHTTLSGEFIEYNEVTPENAASYHFHGDPEKLPISAIIVLPYDAKSASLLKARMNGTKTLQMVRPSEVIEDLLSDVFRVKSFFDSLSATLALSTALLVGLVMLLSARLRAREMDTLNRIGCARPTVALLYLTEITLVTVAGAALAGVALLATRPWLADLLKRI